MDDRSIQSESNIEILRAQRAAARRGRTAVQDTIRENEGVDEDDPLISVDDGIRLEPFNMRREMAEGHFDEGGFYILNKEEEKEVTDAWLDTVDQAERTATFQQIDRQIMAGETAASRLSALSRNLGEPAEKEDGEEAEDVEGAEGAASAEGARAKEEMAKETPAPKTDEEEAEDPADEISLLEALIGELLPLEKPSEALARLARGGAKEQTAGTALKVRSRIRQARAEVAASTACADQGETKKPAVARSSRRKFSEFGYEESSGKKGKMEAKTEAGPEPPKLGDSGTAQGDEAAAGPVKDGLDNGKPDVEMVAAVADGVAATPAEKHEGVGTKPAVADSAAVAAAAEKAAAKEKAEAEAAAAFAAEMKMTRQTLHMAVDGKSGPEANAILLAEEPRSARDSSNTDQSEPAPARRRAATIGSEEAERRRNIGRLTDLCDRLLQRGVLVYDSTRELLAIEVRERKGEQLGKDGAVEPTSTEEKGEKTDVPPSDSSAGCAGEGAGSAPCQASPIAETASAGFVLFENKRYQPPDGQSAGAVVEGDTVAASVAAVPLLWQYRWSANPQQIHGPFDSVTMHGWITQACFADERPAEVRQCDTENEALEACWHRWSDVNFALYL